MGMGCLSVKSGPCCWCQAKISADGDLLLMPCLDFVPEHRDDMPLFFTKAQKFRKNVQAWWTGSNFRVHRFDLIGIWELIATKINQIHKWIGQKKSSLWHQQLRYAEMMWSSYKLLIVFGGPGRWESEVVRHVLVVLGNFMLGPVI